MKSIPNKRTRGQSLIEGTFVMLVFFALLLGVADFGQTVVAHQSLVERVRTAARWGSIHTWEGPDPVMNEILYGQPEVPNPAGAPFLGLKPENIQIRYRAASADRPDDETLTVEITRFETPLYSPWLAGSLISAACLNYYSDVQQSQTR
jgi:hypothetical protein